MKRIATSVPLTAFLLGLTPTLTTAKAIKPLAAQTKATVNFSVSASAERRTADSDPLGARTRFKILRSAAVTCRMIATAPEGVGPDGPTTQQKAVLEAAASSVGTTDSSADPDPLDAKVAACGEDAACQITVSMETARTPALRNQADAAEARNKAATKPVENASARQQAMLQQPNWQRLVPDVDPNANANPCIGTISADDLEVYRFGFDGRGMGDSKETRKGSSAIAWRYIPPPLWFDLRSGRVGIDVVLADIKGSVRSVNVGARGNARNPLFRFNQDWEPRAGARIRLQRADVQSIAGAWTISVPISPKSHESFPGLFRLA